MSTPLDARARRRHGLLGSLQKIAGWARNSGRYDWCDKLLEAVRIIEIKGEGTGICFPFSFSDLGITVHVKEEDTGLSLGKADTSKGIITLRPGQNTIQQVCILIHEMMHITEGSLRERGWLTKDIDHDFIHAASFGCAVALARSGVLSGVDSSKVNEFLSQLEYEPNEKGTK